MTKLPTRFFLALSIIILLLVLAAGIYYFRFLKTSNRQMVATGQIDVFLKPGEEKVGYFVPGQKFTLTGQKQKEFVEVIDDQYTLWISEDGAYQLQKD